jgi:sulfur relay (sulfurtransferase) DsrC/TusE family protein
VKPEQWSEDLALEIARQNGLPDLTDRHWLVIRFMRDFACKASVDMFGLEKADFVDDVEDIITVGEFYQLAAGGQIIFT